MYLELHTYEPTVDASLPDVLFVSGVGHTSTCWDYLLPLFQEANIRTHTFNFRGHGNSQGKESVVSNRLQDYVNDLHTAVHTLQLSEKPFVLVAHSMGGYVAQVALQQAGMPGLVGLILLATLTPRLAGHPLVTFNLVSFLAHDTRAFFRGVRLGDFYPLVASEEAVRYLFFSHATPISTVRFCQSLLQSDSLRALLDLQQAVSPERGKRLAVPVQVIGAEDDHIIPVRLLRKMATVYGVLPVILAGGHDIMLDVHHHNAAEAMVGWIGALPIVQS